MTTMSRRGGLLIGLVLVAAAGAGIAVAVFGPPWNADRPTSGSVAQASAIPGRGTPAATPATDAPGPAPTTPASSTAEPAPAEPPADDTSSGPGADTEIQPPAPDPADPTALPASDPIDPLLRGPAPATATAQGALVAGFPSLIQATPDSRVSSSMVASEGAQVQAALTATTEVTVDAVREHFDTIFATHDLHPTAVPAVGGSTALAYARGAETVTVTLTALANGGCSYSIVAHLVAVG